MAHSHTDVERDIELPFEELEPCCQKEILSRRKEKEFQEKIRQFDRSNVRLDENKRVLRDVKNRKAWTCHCCQSSSDYDMLSSLKQKIKEEASLPFFDQSDCQEGSDSEDDLLEDDYISPAQQAILNMAAEKKSQMERLSSQGLALHLDESPEHFIALMKNPAPCCIVLHVYESNSISALVDMALERLASVYIGTFFRRILKSKLQYNHDNFFLDLMQYNGSCIVAVKDGRVIDVTNEISIQLSGHWPSDSVDNMDSQAVTTARNLIENRMLHLHVLSNEIKYAHSISDQCSDAEYEDSESYCDVAGCGRKFPHKHIASSSSGHSMSSSLLLSDSDGVLGSSYTNRI